jgi:hypothetical protein
MIAGGYSRLGQALTKRVNRPADPRSASQTRKRDGLRGISRWRSHYKKTVFHVPMLYGTAFPTALRFIRELRLLRFG